MTDPAGGDDFDPLDVDIGAIGRQRSNSAPAAVGRLTDLEDLRPSTSATAAGDDGEPVTGGRRPRGGKRSISVLCRFRPEDANEIANGGENIANVSADGTTVTLKIESSASPTMKEDHEFRFNKVFPSYATQTDLQSTIVFPIVDNLFQGVNCSIVAYGQTGSGKTYTMMGVVNDQGAVVDAPGVVPRTLTSIFSKANERAEEWEVTVGINFVEIYMERLQDLLAGAASAAAAAGAAPQRFVQWGGGMTIGGDKIEIRDIGNGTLQVTNCVRAQVSTAADALSVIERGLRRRATAATSMNAYSSRSHAIVLLTLTQVDRVAKSVVQSQLYFADLAGSEKVAKSETAGMRLEEAKMINKSLFALGQVITALTTKPPRGRGLPAPHVPYRDSKLTRLLENSLGGNALTFVIATCSPSSFNEQETLSTLRFASKAQLIKTAPVRNVSRSAAELELLLERANVEIGELKAQVQQLNSQLAVARDMGSAGGSGALATAAGAGASFVTARRLHAMTMAVMASIRCPLSGKLFRDPVVCLDGHTYERRDISDHLLANEVRSPITGDRMNAMMMVPNFMMKSFICALNNYMLIDGSVARRRTAFDSQDIVSEIIAFLPQDLSILSYARVSLTFARAIYDKNRWTWRIDDFIRSRYARAPEREKQVRDEIRGMTLPAHKIFFLITQTPDQGDAAKRLRQCQFFAATEVRLFSSTIRSAGK